MTLRRLALLVGAALLVLAGAVSCMQRPHYHGPASDHFDGRRFFLPNFDIGKGLVDVARWWLTTERAQWPDHRPLAARDVPPERVQGDRMRVSFVGHATLLVQTAGLNILTDPIWSERAFPVAFAGPRRVREPGIRFEDLPPIDLVIVSHNHYDHMDLPTLRRLAREHDPLFVMGLGNDAIFGADDGARVQTVDWWESVDVAASVRVTAVPVLHWSRRGLFDRNKALWAGYVLEAPGGSVFFGGDTGLGDGEVFRSIRQRFGPFRLALLPLGSYAPRWFMRPQHIDPDEAVQVHGILEAAMSIGMHFGTFQLSDEAVDEPLRLLDRARREHGLAPDEFITLPFGAATEVPRLRMFATATPHRSIPVRDVPGTARP